MSWIATAGAGLTLIATWLERGGLRARGLRRLSPTLLLVHILPAVLGLLVWIAYVATDSNALAWVAVAIIAFVAGWGVRNFILWQRRRAGFLRATRTQWNLPLNVATSPHLPAEQHFPVAVVVLHGALGVTTFVLTLLSAAVS